MTAYNTAATMAYGEAGITQVEAMDGSGDPACAERDGEIFDIDPDTGEVLPENDNGISSEDHPNGTLAFLPVMGGGSAQDNLASFEADLGPVALASEA